MSDLSAFLCRRRPSRPPRPSEVAKRDAALAFTCDACSAAVGAPCTRMGNFEWDSDDGYDGYPGTSSGGHAGQIMKGVHANRARKAAAPVSALTARIRAQQAGPPLTAAAVVQSLSDGTGFVVHCPSLDADDGGDA